ncbi:hypothetical protein [Actinomadura rubrisoli]|uniref:Nuclear transport factor 2 family protein n=1 Tax=Actinomadura rubrisoli TaxID=2530368 RepID=A0A4R5ANJ8_9ACTN|nr:hypothetical protein [Actinomadura rubrisoli]TDD73320.1 hypothetical protein E1298_34245 [Actinomadura rubrisoli]
MAHRTLVRSGCVLIAVAALAAACGGDDGGDSDAKKVYTVPSSATPKPAADAPDPGARDGIEGARAALQAFLRGQARGDAAVCRYVADGSAFLKGPALKGNCPLGVKNTVHVVRPLERQALRTVVVTGGRLSGEDAVIPFSALHWTSGTMTVSTLQPRFTLRRAEGTWQIVR